MRYQMARASQRQNIAIMQQQQQAAFGQSSNQQPSFPGGNLFSRVMGFSLFAGLFQAGARGLGGAGHDQGAGMNYLWSSAALFVLGLLIETGRTFCQWLIERVQFQYSITAHFTEGDPAYEWLILFLTEKQIWKNSKEFRVSATSSIRKWGVKPDSASASASASGNKLALNLPFLSDLIKDSAEVKTDDSDEKATPKSTDRGAHAEYVPTFEAPQLFKWRGYWVEIKRTNVAGRLGMMSYNPMGGPIGSTMYLTIYTRNMSVLSSFVEEARLGYIKTSRPHVIVHSVDQPNFGPSFTWNNAKSKSRRPLSSIILQEGVINSIVDDAREFLESEDWYLRAGIPHRRGYLLHGPPGTGKSSTIYALAGELGLEIFSLSLASNFVDDAFLARAVAAVPKHAIFLIEDIDCAFPTPRDADDDDGNASMMGMGNFGGGMVMSAMGPVMSGAARKTSLVTLSGLLNVLDGVGSEEGKIFFATTNHIEHLDPALIRPGRIDKKIQYKLATQAQAEALFLRFYPEDLMPFFSASSEKSALELSSLAASFASVIPEHEFSTAELQGYLLTFKKDPAGASHGAAAWIAQEQHDREERKRKEAEKKAKAKEKREEREASALKGPLARLGVQAGAASGAPQAPAMVPLPMQVQAGISGGPGRGATRAMRAMRGGFVGGVGMDGMMMMVPPPNTSQALVGPGTDDIVVADADPEALPNNEEPSSSTSNASNGDSGDRDTIGNTPPKQPLVNGITMEPVDAPVESVLE
ncbi:unnamed protein product [Cyclocybe aegerita]|uniref:P-loop containing nucleoside triphosphate hydrolase protein n=1 Tax=Cyclocybe aegerita TaxID=1973307 RepID=A0A8S0VZS0_CYCAE|nr:unnamed protein product [Cyclocybe aegerita]